MTEDQFQQDAVTWIKNTYCLKTHDPRFIIHSTPNGGKRNKLEAIKLKRTGALSGVLDLTLKMPNSIFIDIELKVCKNNLEDSQIEMIERLESLNCNYIVAWNLEELKSKLIPMVDRILNHSNNLNK
jgi:hypothetical protein